MSDEWSTSAEADEPHGELERVRRRPGCSIPGGTRRPPPPSREGPTDFRVANPEQKTGRGERPAGAELGHSSEDRLAGEGPDRVVSRRGEAEDPDEEREKAARICA